MNIAPGAAVNYSGAQITTVAGIVGTGSNGPGTYSVNNLQTVGSSAEASENECQLGGRTHVTSKCAPTTIHPSGLGVPSYYVFIIYY